MKYLIKLPFAILLLLCGALLSWIAIGYGLLTPMNVGDKGNAYGRFVNMPPVIALNDDGRTSILKNDIVFIDPQGRSWLAPTGTKLDGASIPKPFWSIVGGPYEGLYRNASIVHDAACISRDAQNSDEVHFMFYEACRCGGLDEYNSKLLYAAVFHFGPKWVNKPVYETVTVERDDGTVYTLGTVKMVPENLDPLLEDSDENRKKLIEFIKTKNPELRDIKAWNRKGTGSDHQGLPFPEQPGAPVEIPGPAPPSPAPPAADNESPPNPSSQG